jgi:histone deacetylase 1/2
VDADTSQYFAPDYELDVRPSNMENANSHDYLHKIRSTVIENIRRTGKPSVEAFTNIPNAPPLTRTMDSDAEDEEDDLDADSNRDVRATQLQRDKRIEHGNDYYDESDDEEYKNSLGVRAQPNVKRRRNIIDYPNPNAAPLDDLDALDGMEDTNGESAISTRQPSAVKSRTNTPAVGEQDADEDGDIDMEEPDVSAANAAGSTRSQSPAGVVTPPESPPAAAATTALAPTSAPTADVTMEGVDDATKAQVAAVKEEGQAERDSENVKGEVRTEVAKD